MSSRPAKVGFSRMGRHSTPFYPVKGQFGRTKVLIAEVQVQASRLIELGAALVSNAGPGVIFRLRVGLGDAGRPELVSSRGGTYFDFNNNGKTIRAERAASLAKCLVKNGVNIIIGKYE